LRYADYFGCFRDSLKVAPEPSREQGAVELWQSDG
jgi:hypothetical protein